MRADEKSTLWHAYNACPTKKNFGVFMKVTVKRKENNVPVVISTEFIKLQDALKYANVVYSGGEA